MLGTPWTFGKSWFLLKKFKVFEYILLPFIKQLPLSSSQFGYRSGSSTILATTLLKEAIDGYISDGGTIYTCFLDKSKAFEYVDHELLAIAK